MKYVQLWDFKIRTSYILPTHNSKVLRILNFKNMSNFRILKSKNISNFRILKLDNVWIELNASASGVADNE